jgi:hypothetical protein
MTLAKALCAKAMNAEKRSHALLTYASRYGILICVSDGNNYSAECRDLTAELLTLSITDAFAVGFLSPGHDQHSLTGGNGDLTDR